MIRAALIALAWSAAVASEGPVPPTPPAGTPPPAQPPTMAFTSATATFSMLPAQPSEATQARLRYEEIRIEMAKLAYRVALVPGSPRPVLSAADLVGADGQPILFDSTLSRLPQASFRGVMRPSRVEVRRRDADPQRPREVRFQATAFDMGDFHGLVRTPAGDRQHIAWADKVVMELVAPIDPAAATGMGTPRLAALHLYGREAADGRPARPSVVLRMARPVSGDQALVEPILAARTFGMRATAMVQTLYFDESGNLGSYENNWGDYEVLDGDGLIPRLGPPSKPVTGK